MSQRKQNVHTSEGQSDLAQFCIWRNPSEYIVGGRNVFQVLGNQSKTLTMPQTF